MIQKDKLLILFFFSLLSCNNLKKEQLNGIYRYESKISRGYLAIKDSVFEYNYEAPLFSDSSSGTWSFSKNSISLKSYEDYNGDFIEVEEGIKEGFGYIEVVDKNGWPISKANVKIDGKISKYSTDETGRVNIYGYHPKKIEINYIGLSKQNNTYVVKSYESNIFSIKIFEQKQDKRYFNFEKFKINKKKVIIDNKVFVKK